jgi:uncharacterized membrane protein
MIDAVLAFGFLLAAMEFVVLSMIPPKYRLRILGSKSLSNALHFLVFGINLAVHWGTVTGTMSATLAFVASMITVSAARFWYGTITDDVRTRKGIVNYRNEELIL